MNRLLQPTELQSEIIKPNYISFRYRRCVFLMLRTIEKKLSTNYTPSLLPDKRAYFMFTNLISRKVLFVGTSFSLPVLLRDVSCYARSSDSNRTTALSNQAVCYPYTILALISAFLLRSLYRARLKQLVREGIPGMDFYSLFSYIIIQYQ